MLDINTPATPLDEAFWKFHEENINVFFELVKLAKEAKNVGRKKIGIGMLFEVLRWNSMIRTKGSDFKLNNSFRSRYVRLIEEQYPELSGFFEKRSLHS